MFGWVAGGFDGKVSAREQRVASLLASESRAAEEAAQYFLPDSPLRP